MNPSNIQPAGGMPPQVPQQTTSQVVPQVAPVSTQSVKSDVNKPKASGADIFLHLGAFFSLYVCIGSLLYLLYTVIDTAFPPVSSYSGYSYGYLYTSSISFQVATLIVFLPIYLIISWIVQKRYEENPLRKETPNRKGLIYFTLLVSGLVMAGDLVTVIYLFLNGEDFTFAFILKAISVILVFAGVFYYYVQDVRNRLTIKVRLGLRIFAIAFVVLSIIWGFSVVGSPRTQRYQKLDQQKVYDLQNIQSNVISVWQNSGALPENSAQLYTSLSPYGSIKKDSQTGLEYEYNKTGTYSFELCAVFNTDAPKNSNDTYAYKDPNSQWNYTKGHYCFERKIDTQKYPSRYRPPLTNMPESGGANVGSDNAKTVSPAN